MRTATTKHNVPTASISISDISLDSLFLLDCDVSRGDGDPSDPGAVTAEIEAEYEVDDGALTYAISGLYTLHDSAEEQKEIARISVTYAAVYSLPEGVQFSDDEILTFQRSVILQVTPFQREFLASLTNRMGLPTFYLPLMRSSDIVKNDLRNI